MLKQLIPLILLVLLFINVKCSMASSCDNQVLDIDRVDCFPEAGSNQNDCTNVNRGCCWKLPTNSTQKSVPYCYYPRDFNQYKVTGTFNFINRETNEKTFIYQIEKNETESNFFRGKEILKLEVQIIITSINILNVKIIDPNNKNRYQVTIDKVDSSNKWDEPVITDTEYQIYVENEPFSLKVYRKSNGKLLFDTSVGPLIYTDQYIEFSSRLANTYLYGLGEHRHETLYKTTDNWDSYSFWNRDDPPYIGSSNLYGTHPFYMIIEDNLNSHGFFYLNSNAMEINLQPAPSAQFITTGGVINYYLYLGSKPQDVIEQHTSIIGRPSMPQYWTLGFQLCRWKYNNSTNLFNVITRNRKASIPQDGQWTDIDAMSAQYDWTFDSKNFANLSEIVNDLHSNGQHYINIIDPAIRNINGYYPFDLGVDNNVFIKDDNDEILIGRVWPGDTAFPDFTNPNTTKWWSDVSLKFHSLIPFDGIWIDMNEPSNFVDGSINGCNLNSTLNSPPFVPTKISGGNLYSKTICPSATQYLSTHYNLHNMYGHYEAIATYKALLNIDNNKRPFVLTRSTFAGTGQYSAHWSGDNAASILIQFIFFFFFLIMTFTFC
jgi:alpha-glucosidase (family GH31 glycosyl hydrolase)